MEQMDKNTVEAKNQLKETEVVRFEGLENEGLRVMFVGNSITLHGIKEDIGWMNCWGMAASTKENDYVHRCMKSMKEIHPDAAFCICQAARWEIDYKNGKETYPLFESARDFEADIMIVRLVENCRKNEYERDVFLEEYEKFIQYLNKKGTAKIIVTTGFWKHPADEAIRACAYKNGFTICELGDLGELDEMKAIGLFEHSGVANHPGDLGMQHIAERIMDTFKEYKVKINGQEVKLENARVSAVPFNCRWPGHQRPLDQSEMTQFLLLEMSEKAEFEITPKKPFEKVEIRPKTLGITPEVTKEGTIKFTLDKPAYFTVEPYGRKQALHIFADAPKTYDVDIADDNVIYYGPGEHEVGQIELKSNQTLFLDEGAVVYACIRAIDAENIRILGKGILDNSHNKEHILFDAKSDGKDQAVKNATRQHTIQLEYCTNIEIDGITIRDSLVYNVRPVGCKNLHIANVKILGCWRYNSDGIDMHNCENVLIENCFLRTFDDSICIKGFDCYYDGDVEEEVRKAMYRNGKCYDVFKDVVVRNCVIWNDWGKCLEIGAETRAEEMYNIVFEDCDIIHVTHYVLDCMNVDFADVHDVVYRNINVEYDEEIPAPLYQETDDMVYENKSLDYAPAVICAQVKYHHEYSAGGVRRGRNRKLLFENIRLYGRQKPIFSFCGYNEEFKTENVEIRNFYWNDKPLKEDDYVMKKGEYCENIRITYNY